jgi:Rho termination factor, N-terminal domain
MPTPQRDNDPQSSILSAVREGQAAVIDVLRVWSDIGQQLTRDLRLPIARIDLDGAVDRAFDVAEQTLAAQRQLALTLTGLATRQVDLTVATAVETVDTAVEAADTTVETVEGTVRERAHQVEGESRDRRERAEQPQAGKGDTATAASPKQDRRPDGRTYEERSVEELRERAAELQIEGRSAMSKDELITALRNHRKSRSAKNDAPGQNRGSDRRTYEERSLEELRERARELDIEGRSAMSKDELIATLRQQAR